MVTAILIGIVGAYIGGAPFGPINLSLIDISLNKGPRDAHQFIYSASFVEIGQAATALIFGNILASYYSNSMYFKPILFLFFTLLGAFFLFKKTNATTSPQYPNNHSNSLVSGLVAAILNPQAIPFWLFVFGYIQGKGWFCQLQENNMSFLIGVAIGKFLILHTYGAISQKLATKLAHYKLYIGKGIGVLLVSLGVFNLF